MTCGRNCADHPDQRLGGDLDRLEREAALGQRRQRVALGQAGVDEAEPLCCTPRISWRPWPSRRGAPGACRAGCAGRPCSRGLSTSPRSPPVQETTSTSTPSAAYFAIVAAPLLDSSSGCACTAISRSRSATCTPAHVLEPVITDNGSSTMDLVPHHVTVPCAAPRRKVSPCRSPARLPAPPSGGSSAPSGACSASALADLVGAGQHARAGHLDRPGLPHVTDRSISVDVRRPPPDRPRRVLCRAAPSTATTAPVGAVTVTIPAGGEASVHRVTPRARPPRGRDRRGQELQRPARRPALSGAARAGSCRAGWLDPRLLLLDSSFTPGSGPRDLHRSGSGPRFFGTGLPPPADAGATP